MTEQAVVPTSVAATSTHPHSSPRPKGPSMTDAVCDTRTHTRATRFAGTVDVDCHKELPRIDQPDCASMISGAPARPYCSTARPVRGDGLQASAASARGSQGTHTQPDR